MDMNMDKLYEYLQAAIDKVVYFLPKIALAGIILWIGFKVVKKQDLNINFNLYSYKAIYIIYR